MSRLFLIGFCGFLLALNAFSSDITLPSFAAMSRDLARPIEQVQLVIPVFLVGSAIGQLLFGPASDRFGRRPVILLGIALYMAGALVGFLAPSMGVVLAGRALQGFGSACCVVVARAVLRDSHEGSELARAMAMAMAIISFGPIMAPLLGFGLVVLGGWRGVFAGMALFGACLMTAGVWRLRETNRQPDPTALQPGRLWSSLGRVLGHPQSRFFILLSAINSFLILSFVTNAPRLFQSAFGIEGLAFVLLFGANGFAVIIGQLLNARAIGRLGVLATTRLAATVLLTMAAATALLAATGCLTLAAFVVLMFTFGMAFPIVMSNAASMVIDPHREIAGFASSAFGFVSQLGSSVLVFATLPLIRGAMLPWAIAMTATAAIVCGALWFYRPRSAADGAVS